MAEILENRKLLDNPTPMMKQYLEVKEEYDDYVLLYRLGDFYECFFEDAIIVSRVLELTLTARDCGNGKRAAMCGVPYHKVDVHLGKLVSKGYKVAICEQVENPKEAAGLVKRDVVKVVTPGTVTDESILTNTKNNFLGAVCKTKEAVGLAFGDITTGEIFATTIRGEELISRVLNELNTYQPSELIINTDYAGCKEFCDFSREKFNAVITETAKAMFAYEYTKEKVKKVFDDDSDKLTDAEGIMAVGALLIYASSTQKTETTFFRNLTVYSKGQYLELDINTKRNLELVETMRSKEKRGTLLWVLDKTKTSMGARLLRSWILHPVLDPAIITHRQAAIKDLLSDIAVCEELEEILSGILDVERLLAKVVYGSASAKDLKAIEQSISGLPIIKSLISKFQSSYLTTIFNGMDTLEDISDLLSRAIIDTPPHTVREGGMIKEGFNTDVDYYRSIRENGSQIMQSIEQNERELTGIKTLKVDYNKVFGYYIEVTKSFLDSVPDRYVRKQTLTNCERYITQELKEMENSIFNADEMLVNIEYDLFCQLRGVVQDNCERIRRTASLIAELDVFRSLAVVASKNGYVCPEIDISEELIIKDGRHPVVEKFVTDSYFVPNDTVLDTSNNKVMIITGPNMAGKSTYMRQVALITIMAQIGSFIPAKEARIGIVDKIFTRVGASDDLASGQSTFMLEMSEVAFILKNATKKSLIIYDEVGRGTSTFDGMSIARAVVEYTYSKKIGAKTLFATHYHELTDMEGKYHGIINYNIAAKKRGDSIIFLRKIVRGGTDDSYGIEVAKLAGVPNEVVKRAKEILAEIEKSDHKPNPKINADNGSHFDLFSEIAYSKDSEVAEKIKNLDINTITPIESLNFLFELKKMING